MTFDLILSIIQLITSIILVVVVIIDIMERKKSKT